VVATGCHGPAQLCPEYTDCVPPELVTSKAGAARGVPPAHVATTWPPSSDDAMVLWPSNSKMCTVMSLSGDGNVPMVVPP
jgi:hypothetical protein